MKVEIVEENSDSIIIKIPLKDKDTFLKTEEEIMKTVHSVGRILTKKSLIKLDENSETIERNNEILTLKNIETKTYQTPYGAVDIERSKYETKDKKTYNPLEDKSRMIRTTTPKLAKTIESKYINMPSNNVQKDLEENHNLKISKSFIQNISYTIGKINQNMEINYKLPEIEEDITIVSIGIDGVYAFVGANGWRETMVGTISLYNNSGDRKHTIYVAEAPEYGKYTFKEKMSIEIENLKKILPESTKYIGLADGAIENWKFLEPYTDEQILDFYHASEYLTNVSKVINLKNEKKQKKWLENACHILKNEKNGALILLKEMEELNNKKLPKALKDGLKRSITYFNNHYHQMNYKEAIDNKLPIGSGVTESACKVIVKQRLCISGAKWSNFGASSMLNLKAINSTNGRWQQFWDKISA